MNGLDYVLVGDCYISTIELPEDDDRPIGKWGRMHRAYLEETNPLLLSHLISTGRLHAHLLSIEDAAHDLLDSMMPGMAKEAGATEDLKARDPMRWVALMNCCKAQVEEIIFAELIYC
nr:TnpV protein [uncultured Oscillibacter sp.]